MIHLYSLKMLCISGRDIFKRFQIRVDWLLNVWNGTSRTVSIRGLYFWHLTIVWSLKRRAEGPLVRLFKNLITRRLCLIYLSDLQGESRDMQLGANGFQGSNIGAYSRVLFVFSHVSLQKLGKRTWNSIQKYLTCIHHQWIWLFSDNSYQKRFGSKTFCF